MRKAGRQLGIQNDAWIWGLMAPVHRTGCRAWETKSSRLGAIPAAAEKSPPCTAEARHPLSRAGPASDKPSPRDSVGWQEPLAVALRGESGATFPAAWGLPRARGQQVLQADTWLSAQVVLTVPATHLFISEGTVPERWTPATERGQHNTVERLSECELQRETDSAPPLSSSDLGHLSLSLLLCEMGT